MSNVLDSIREMRKKAKETEVRYYPKSGNGKNKSPNDFDEGKNYLRVAPNHNPEKYPSPFYPFRSTWLEVELGFDRLSRYNLEKLITMKSLIGKFGVDKVSELSEWEDDKIKEILVEELGADFKMKTKKRVFISTLHGKLGSQDLVEEYIKFVVKFVNEEIDDRDEARKKLSPVFGYRDKDKKWVPGISPQTAYVFYAWEWGTEKNFYKVDIYEKMMDKIEELYSKFDDPEKPLTIDPFSDKSEGIAIVFDKFKNEKQRWDFSIYDQPFDGRKHDSYKEYIKEFALNEDQLKHLKEVKPLHEIYGRGVFRKRDFELQLNGLILFDEKFGFNAFAQDDFLDIVEVIAAQYEGEEEEKEEEPYNPLTGEGKKPDEAAAEVKDETIAEVQTENVEVKTDLDVVLDQKPGKVVEQEKENNAEIGTNSSIENKLATLRKNVEKK